MKLLEIKNFYKFLASEKLISTIIILLWLIVSGLPIYFLFITSLKTDSEVYSPSITWIPQKIVFEAYLEALFGKKPFSTYVLNSVFLCAFTTLICAGLSTTAAYGFSRFRFRGKNATYFAVLGSRLLPPISLLVPWFIMILNIGLFDSLFALVLANIYMNLPLAVWLLTGFFNSIPRDIDEAALTDGCNRFQAFRRVILPIATNGIFAVMVITFLNTWNEFLFAITLSQTSASRVVTGGVYEFVTDAFIDWPSLCASGVISSIPAILFVACFQRFLVRGMLRGVVKR